MEQILSELSVSITELRKQPSKLIEKALGQTVAVLSHNKPAAYLVAPETYRALLDAIEEKALAKIVESRKRQLTKAKRVTLDDL